MKEKFPKKNKDVSLHTPEKRLRQQAERLYSTHPPHMLNLTSLEKDTLLQELEVHQIELEIQNEELRQAQHELEESSQRYTDLFDFGPVGYFVLDKYFIIKQINIAGSRMFGPEQAAAMDQGVFAMLKQAREKMGPGTLIIFNPLHGRDQKGTVLGEQYLPATDGAMMDDFDRSANLRQQSTEYLANELEEMRHAVQNGNIIV